MVSINFFEVDVNSRLKQKRKFKRFLSDIFYEEKKKVEKVTIVFVDDKYILRLNNDFLQHNYFTDTLTFTLSPKTQPIIGEIYISVETVRKNAHTYSVEKDIELERVIIHSCLHLCGYKDKPKIKWMKMENRQEFYLKKWLVSRETIM
jgi:rRNA maturation RNase YbeY